MSEPHPTSDTAEPAGALSDPRLLPFLPLIYVAWADGRLEGGELDAIRSAVAAQVGSDGQALLAGWLDPVRPPTPQALSGLLAQLRRAAASLGPPAPRSLADLGLALGGHTAKLEDPESPERRALREVETALGLVPAEAVARLLPPEDTQPPGAPFFGSRVPVDALARLLDGPERETRERVRALLRRPQFRYLESPDRAAYRERVLAWCRDLAAEGLGALSFPAELGGGGDVSRFVATFGTLAHFDLSLLVKFGVQFGLFGGAILQLGTARHHRLYLQEIGTLALPGCFAMSETGHGSNVRDVETVAWYDAGTREFEVLTPHDGARKDYIGNAACHGRMAVVFAQLAIGDERHGVHAFLVPIRDAAGHPLPAVRIEDCGEKLGLNGVDNGRLAFDRARIPRENLLDRFGTVSPEGIYSSPIPSAGQRFFTMLGTLVGGRVSVAVAASSAAKSALTIAVRYAARRRQFGPEGRPEVPILDYLSHQRRLLPRLAATYAFEFALRDLVRRYAASSTGDDAAARREVEALAAGLKALSTWHATDTIQTARECCGGQGYLAVNRLAALKADTDVFTTFEGDNTVLLQLVAKNLLGEYKHQFEDLDLIGLVRHLARRAASTVAERNPLATHATNAAHLRDRSFQLGALAWREEHLLATVAARLKKRLDRGVPSYRALVECQDHLLATARAHVERILLARFAEAIDEAPSLDAEIRAPLARLCDLFALSRLELDGGWFQEHGILAAAKAKAIRSQIDRLCGELAPDAVALVDAFAIPDECLAAPIALGALRP
ncbi:MAG TPA: acyl-CoA dehydrogenase [Thermoanaerobaculia bacterium]|nr:acyl-CoA dehydrogenase [Thermoanaerobaculia bacterium]